MWHGRNSWHQSFPGAQVQLGPKTDIPSVLEWWVGAHYSLKSGRTRSKRSMEFGMDGMDGADSCSHLRCQALRWYKTTLERCIAEICFHMVTLVSSARQTRRNLTVDHLGRRYSVYRCILEWSYAEICRPTRLESLSVQKPSFHSTEMPSDGT